jgi:hypothetical protein
MSYVAYDGEALRTGEMDVRDLAPALMGLGDMVRDANRALNGERADASVKVRSDFKTGSFGVVIRIIQTLSKNSNLFDQGALVDALALAKMLGLAAVSEKPKGFNEVVENIFELAKFLAGGTPKEKKSVDANHTEITNEAGGTVIVNNGTVIVYEDRAVRADMKRVVQPLTVQGIDTFETRGTPSGVAIETITKDEARLVSAPFQEPLQIAAASEPSKPEVETRSTGLFQIASLDWKDGNKWRLDAGQGEFWAEITDHLFLNRVHRHEIVFGEGDVLKAEYVSESHRKSGKIVSTTTLTRILAVIPPELPSEQSSMM